MILWFMIYDSLASENKIAACVNISFLKLVLCIYQVKLNMSGTPRQVWVVMHITPDRHNQPQRLNNKSDEF